MTATNALVKWPQIEAAWDLVLDQHPHSRQVAFMEARYIASCLKHYGKPDTLVFEYKSNSEHVLAIVERVNAYSWQIFLPSQLPLAAMVHNTSGLSEACWRALFTSLPGMALQVSLSHLDPLILPPEGDHFPAFDTSVILLEGEFDTYWMSRSKNLKGNYRNSLNKLKAEGASIEFRVLMKPEDMPQALIDYANLEASGWKNDAGTAVGGSNAQLAFYTEVMQTLAGVGQARVFQTWLLKPEHPPIIIASDLCLERESTQILLKTAYSEAYGALSPATLLRHDILAFLYAEGKIKRIELYGKRYDWHTRWTEHARTIYHRNVYRYAWLGHLKKWLKRS